MARSKSQKAINKAAVNIVAAVAEDNLRHARIIKHMFRDDMGPVQAGRMIGVKAHRAEAEALAALRRLVDVLTEGQLRQWIKEIEDDDAAAEDAGSDETAAE